MNPRLTLFTATLVQDSALSVSGLDRESTADQPFTIVDGVPILSGRGLKGAAVAMARRFFDPLPRSISEGLGRRSALRRSAWEFANARPSQNGTGFPRTRAGVGILQQTGARASGVLYDREVTSASTRWDLVLRVDWRYAGSEGLEAEGILGYVLSNHWADGRCWLGGGVARGLGWCHIEAESLRAYRLDDSTYDDWVRGDRKIPPQTILETIPTVTPTHSWCFVTRDVTVRFGEYRPDHNQSAWGVDMFTVGPHDSEKGSQPVGNGTWARPVWVGSDARIPERLATDRALLMEGGAPLLPGASVRGPMRHAFSRRARSAGHHVTDPHLVQGDVGDEDAAGNVFGTVARSSQVLIRDATAEAGWTGARLHMHAEDEFSAGSYGSAKRDASRLLSGSFQVRVVVEGRDPANVASLVKQIDDVIALGALGHLPVGGHKTRGAGWGTWDAKDWQRADVVKARAWEPAADAVAEPPARTRSDSGGARAAWAPSREHQSPTKTHLKVEPARLEGVVGLTLGDAVKHAKADLGASAVEGPLVAWWCEPAIDFGVATPPTTFGRVWPAEDTGLQLDEIVFCTPRAAWRAARTATGWRKVLIREVPGNIEGAEPVAVELTPARLHRDTTRFPAALTDSGWLVVRQWRADDQIVGYTLAERTQP